MDNRRKSERIAFGYWPRKVELSAGRAVIRPVENYDDIVMGMKQNRRVANGWLYPPLVETYDRNIPTEKLPRIYKRVFYTDSTHRLVIPRSATSRQLGEFLIALLGMLEGLRLIPEGWNHFYRAAVKPNSLSEVNCGRRDLEQVLTIAQVFWLRANAEVRRLMFGAVHWRLFCESYEHEFERFGGQYTVLDTCWKICERLHGDWWTGLSPKKKSFKPGHASRAELLARRHKMRIPSWAKTRKSRSKAKKPRFCKLSQLRNNFFHEGLYGKTPTGFGYPKNFKGSIDFQLAAFNTRLLLAIIGVKCGYVRSSAETHCHVAIDLD